MLIEEVLVIQHSAFNIHHSLRALPRPGEPAAHVRICLALLPSGPDAVRRLRLHRDRAAVRPAAVPLDGGILPVYCNASRVSRRTRGLGRRRSGRAAGRYVAGWLTPRTRSPSAVRKLMI